MTTPNGATIEVAVENHPIFHEWTSCKDYTVERTARGRILIIKRYEYCAHCPTERISIIDVGPWRVVGRRYVYVKGVTISRMNKGEWYKQRFLSTTDLPEADVAQLARARVTAAVVK